MYLDRIIREEPTFNDNPILARVWREMQASSQPEEESAAEPDDWRLGSIPGTLEKSLGDRAHGRLIHGIASSSSLNSHGYALIAHGVEVTLPVPILSQHEGLSTPIGEVFYIARSLDRVYVRAEIFDNEAGSFAWDLIRRGEVRCFSGAGRNLQRQGVVDGKSFYSGWKLFEVSICRQGANPDSWFDILRPGDTRSIVSACRPLSRHAFRSSPDR